MSRTANTHFYIKNQKTNTGSYNISQQDALFFNFISIYNSTYFGQTYRPST